MTSKSGDIKILNVQVRNVEGEFFSWVETSEDAILVPNRESIPILIRYKPTDVGYHRAAITITSDAGKDLGDEVTVGHRAVLCGDFPDRR